MAPRPRFRVARGSVEDVLVTRHLAIPVFREGWWWVCDGIGQDGQPYDPEGPFPSKRAAHRHLLNTLAGRVVLPPPSRYRLRRTMPTALRIRHTRAMRDAAILDGRSG